MKTDDIRTRIARLRGARLADTPSPNTGDTSLLARATRLSLDLIGPVLVGAFLGGMGDRALSTFPLLLIIGFFLGMAAGFWNLYKFLQADAARHKKP